MSRITRKFNKIRKIKTNKKRYIRKRKSEKKRKTRKQRGGLVWTRRETPARRIQIPSRGQPVQPIKSSIPAPESKYQGEFLKTPPESGATGTKLSDETPAFFNFLTQLKEVGTNQYPGAKCLGVGIGKVKVNEYGNCAAIIKRKPNQQSIETFIAYCVAKLTDNTFVSGSRDCTLKLWE